MSTSLTSLPAQTRTRRKALAVAIERQGGTWTADRAARTNASGGWGPNRNTARKDLHALARDGWISIVPRTAARSYVLREDRQVLQVNHG